MEEATKYIGWPYVWGGSSPSTSFDCSGFVCWVYTASGVHNLPRTTAQGIYNQCAIISPSEAKYRTPAGAMTTLVRDAVTTRSAKERKNSAGRSSGR